jgi:hypothetical protein
MKDYTNVQWRVVEYASVEEAQEDDAFMWASIPETIKGKVGTVWEGFPDGSYTGLPGSIEVLIEDAHLISAAPDLYKALSAVSGNYKDHDLDAEFGPEIASAIRYALKKAEAAQ